jgi:hypothetical protein
MPVIPSIQADPIKKATTITFSEPVEIPGMVLQPGTYVMKVPDPYTHQWMVGIYNRNESHLYKLVRTVPAYRTRGQLTDKTVITFKERASGAPPAINKWFYPDNYYGRQFVYPKAETIAAVTAPEAAAQIAVATPPAETTPEATAPVEEQEQQSQVEIAQAAPPPEAPQAEQAPAETQPAPEATTPTPAPQELPQTASNLPLVLELGGLLTFLGMFLKAKA